MNQHVRAVTKPVVAVWIAIVFGITGGWAQVNVSTEHNDIGRTGQNLNETILTPQNVNSSTFGKLFSIPVDGLVYSQPLYLSNLTLPGAGVHNVVFVATEHDSVYALDADKAGPPLWQASLIDAAHGAASGATPESSTCDEVTPELGITGTPVINLATGTLYVAAKSTEGGKAIYRLHALDITNGAERIGSPVVIQGTVPNQTGSLSFDATWQRQRTGLLLLNNVVYIAFAAICDSGPWHGWVMGYNASTLAQTGVYTPTPDGTGSGIWMSGAGLAADVIDPVNSPFGRMFFATGNGTYDGLTNYGDDEERLDLANGALTHQDSFTPSIQASLNSADQDLGSGGVLLLPDQPGPHTRLLVQGSKAGTLYLVDRDNMGGYHPTDGNVQQINSLGGLFSAPAYWNGNLYCWGNSDRLRQYTLSNGLLIGPAAMSSEIYGLGTKYYVGGSTPSISANGNTNGIIWNIDSGAQVLYAHDASNVANTLYSTSLGSTIKFSVPTVANGKVYVGGYGQVLALGLLPNSSDFSIAASPSALTIAVGSSGTSTISVAPSGGFAGTVNLSVGPLPAGVVASLSAPSVNTSGSVVLSVSITAGAPGSFPINVQAIAASGTHSTSVMVNVPGVAAAPAFSPAGGTYSAAQSVTLSDSTGSATIYYTLNGSTPTTASTVYSGPIQVASTTTIRAFATASGFSPSGAISATYTIGQASRAASGIWSMETIAGGATPDGSGNNNSAVISAGTLTPGRVGNAIQFDPSTGGALTQRAPFVSTQSFTVAAWVNPVQTSTDQSFVSQPATQVSNFYLEPGINVNGKLVFDFDLFAADSSSAGDAIAVGKTAPNPNTWYHLVGVYDAGNQTVSLYVNGTLEGQAAAGGTFANTGKLAFGYSQWQGARAGGTNALIDEVLAYPVALTGSDISALYASYSSVSPPPPSATSVTLTSPSAGSTLTAPATVNLAATASTTAGSIARVEFYNGTTLVGQSTSGPFTYQWTNVAAGQYSLSAKAYPSTGAPAVSTAVNITVQATSSGSPMPSAQWNLDGAQGGITPDATPAGNNATLTGGYVFVPGKLGQAVQFNPNTGGALTKVAPFDPTQSFSVAAWVNPTNANSAQGLICQPAAVGSTFYLEMMVGQEDNKLVFDFDMFPADSPSADDSIATGTTVAEAGRWYHVVGVYDALNHQALLYVNGALESRVPSKPSFANTGGLAFGYSKWQGGRVEGSDARIDDVRAYGTALTATQVQMLYQGK